MNDLIVNMLSIALGLLLFAFIAFIIVAMTTIGTKSKCELIPNSSCVQCFDGKFESIKCPPLSTEKN